MTAHSATKTFSPHPVRDLLSAVAEVTGISVSEILSERREKAVTKARFMAMALIKSELKLSNPDIGRRMKRDASTVSSGIQKHKAREVSDPVAVEQAAKVRAIFAIIRETPRPELVVADARPATRRAPRPKPDPRPEPVAAEPFSEAWWKANDAAFRWGMRQAHKAEQSSQGDHT